METINELELEKLFMDVKTEEGCKVFTNFIYANANKMDRELYEGCMIAINNKRVELKNPSIPTIE